MWALSNVNRTMPLTVDRDVAASEPRVYHGRARDQILHIHLLADPWKTTHFNRSPVRTD